MTKKSPPTGIVEKGPKQVVSRGGWMDEIITWSFYLYSNMGWDTSSLSCWACRWLGFTRCKKLWLDQPGSDWAENLEMAKDDGNRQSETCKPGTRIKISSLRTLPWSSSVCRCMPSGVTRTPKIAFPEFPPSQNQAEPVRPPGFLRAPQLWGTSCPSSTPTYTLHEIWKFFSKDQIFQLVPWSGHLPGSGS